MSIPSFWQRPNLKLKSKEMYDMTLASQTRLLIAANNPHCLQLYNSDTGDLLATIHRNDLQGKPTRLCMYGSGKAAAGLSERSKIQLINTKDDKLTLDKMLDVNAPVQGIASSGDHLVVLYGSQPWLEVISEKGKSICIFQNQFDKPSDLTVSKDGNLYVSDGTKTITQLDRNLRVLKTFESPQLQIGGSIAILSKDLLVVCDVHDVFLLRLSTGKTSELIKDTKLVNGRVKYCRERKRIYLLSALDSDISVYEKR